MPDTNKREKKTQQFYLQKVLLLPTCPHLFAISILNLLLLCLIGHGCFAESSKKYPITVNHYVCVCVCVPGRREFGITQHLVASLYLRFGLQKSRTRCEFLCCVNLRFEIRLSSANDLLCVNYRKLIYKSTLSVESTVLISISRKIRSTETVTSS